MIPSREKRAFAFVIALALAAPTLAQQEPQSNAQSQFPTTRPDPAAVKSLLAAELAQVDKDLAARMIRRTTAPATQDPTQRAHLELAIDLRIILRTVLAMTVEAQPFTNDQAVLWHRARQLHAAIRGFDEAITQNAGAPPNASQSQAIATIRKLSFDVAAPKPASNESRTAVDLKPPAANQNLDPLLRNLALAMANCVNTTPVDAKSLPLMRPKPLRKDAAPSKDQPVTLEEMTDHVHRLAAVSIPLRQHLLALLKDAGEEKGRGPAHQMLAQAITLAQGLQGNTAVTAEQRGAIELQITEAIAMFMDPRTREAGRSRIDALAQYRQVIGRVGKLALSREQMDQLSPALTWAQSASDTGLKFLTTVERYFDVCAKWDALPHTPANAIPQPLRKPHDDLAAQFAKERTTFWLDAMKIGSGTATGAQVVAGDLDARLVEMTRLQGVADDVLAMNKSFDTLSVYKLRPAGALERKAQVAATAAASTTPSLVRDEGERFLKALRRLADLAQRLAAKPLTDIPTPVAQGWAAGKLDASESRWKSIVYDLGQSLAGGALELDKVRVSRLESALAMIEALRGAAQLEASLDAAAPLSRWADWSTDPASLQLIIDPYKESLAAAFTGFASDQFEAIDRWQKLHARYLPLIALLNRDVSYAEQCEKMPIGFAADLARLATPMDNAPFATERFATYAVALWTTFDRQNQDPAADHVTIVLAKRLARDLNLPPPQDDNVIPRRRPRRPEKIPAP